MKYLTQQFTAHPVGQGLFYSGMVNIKKNNLQKASSFNFVFDCGSLNNSNANDEVDLYRSRHLKEGDALDLLIISHFDADHVNHIKKLLDNRKVKKVVLPFTTLEERLFLILKYYSSLNGRIRPDVDSLVGFMLDPIGSLGKLLHDDSTIYIVNSGPDKPFEDPLEQNTNESNDSGSNINELIFDVNATDIDSTIAGQFYVGHVDDSKLKMFNDSEKGFLKSRTAIMEFLFYRRNAGKDNDSFFEAVYKAFCEKNDLKYQDKSQDAVDALIKNVESITGARPIKELFRDVKKGFPKLHAPGYDIANLNTTALCMLHYNLGAIYTLGNPDLYWNEKNITVIKKFDGTNLTRIEDPQHYIYSYRYHWHPDHPSVHFPNCLLTSDSFLKATDEVTGLYNKYELYWERFWLFQIPHHGAASSAGLELLSRLPYRLAKFINHGAKKIRSWQHPSPQLINDLVASGQSTDVLPVNEFTGLTFGINYPD